MKKSSVSDINLNIFNKYVIRKGQKKQNINNTNKSFSYQKIRKKLNSVKIKDTILPNEIFKEKEYYNMDDSLKIKNFNRDIMTPLQRIKQNFLLNKKHNNKSKSLIDLFSTKISKFSINNLLNSSLLRVYLDKSYKKILYKRLEPFMSKKEENNKLNLKLDLTKTHFNKTFYIPIKKKGFEKNKKREIGVQSSMSIECINNDSNNINNKEEHKNKESLLNYNYNSKEIKIKNYIVSIKKIEKPKIKNAKFIFNKYDNINKELLRNYWIDSNENKRNSSSKIKRIVSTEKQKIDEFLEGLRIEQKDDKNKKKLELLQLNRNINRKNKIINYNNHNLFL